MWSNWIRKLFPGRPTRTGTLAHRKPIRKGAHRFQPRLDTFEDRVVPAITLSGYDAALGQVTFTGDAGSDDLILSINGGLLEHNILGGGLNSPIDLDPVAPGNQTLTVGSGTSRNITVNLDGGDDFFTLDTTWLYNHKITYDGGASTETNFLIGNDTGRTWTIDYITAYSVTVHTLAGPS